MWESIAVVDWLFIAMLVGSTLVGVWRGVVIELMSIASWVAAFLLAQWFAPQAAQWLPMAGAGEAIRYAAGFAVVFLATMLTGGLLGIVLAKFMGAVGLRPVDRLLGAAFGLVRAGLLILVITAVTEMTPIQNTAAWQHSVGVHKAQSVLGFLKPWLPQAFAKHFS